ncbi:hypothetical protein [Microbacterium sp. ZW T5_56]|uniref:hypothetical protein n=1 Tax=Microbacterium sp. ZW T5_56 TaxID=3378081 RepID=UPI0038540EAD
MRLFAAMSRGMSLTCDAIGFVNQRDALSYPPRWKHHDLGSATVFASFRYLQLLKFRLLNDAVVLDARNVYAIQAALQEDGDVALLWGAAHLPGMIRLLGEAGFEQSALESAVIADWPIPARNKVLVGGFPGVGDLYPAVAHPGVILSAEIGRRIAAVSPPHTLSGLAGEVFGGPRAREAGIVMEGY